MSPHLQSPARQAASEEIQEPGTPSVNRPVIGACRVFCGSSPGSKPGMLPLAIFLSKNVTVNAPHPTFVWEPQACAIFGRALPV
jgi:hypothetical protein